MKACKKNYLKIQNRNGEKVDKIIRNILTKIESNGYEAYLIGGYVRDLLVGKTTTNATPRELLEIFP